MVCKFGNMVTYLDGLLPLKLRDFLMKWSSKIIWQAKTIIISLTTVSMATKLGRIVTYLERFPPI